MFQTRDPVLATPSDDLPPASLFDDLRAGFEASSGERANRARETLLGASTPADLWRPVADWRID